MLIPLGRIFCYTLGQVYVTLVSFGNCYKNSKKHYTVIKVLGSAGLTLLHSTNSPKFKEHFNQGEHFSIQIFSQALLMKYGNVS